MVLKDGRVVIILGYKVTAQRIKQYAIYESRLGRYTAHMTATTKKNPKSIIHMLREERK